MFDALYRDKEQIEQAFGAPLDWRRLYEKKSSIIGYAKTMAAHDQENWPEGIEWMVRNTGKLHTTFAPRIPQLRGLIG